jgi:hypothetical protein
MNDIKNDIISQIHLFVDLYFNNVEFFISDKLKY